MTIRRLLIAIGAGLLLGRGDFIPAGESPMHLYPVHGAMADQKAVSKD
jgi:hypothetical protein